MPTTFTIDHDRQWTDSEVAAVIARGTATTNVMDVAGADAQGLPGVEMAQYQTDTDDLETKDTALKAKLAEIQALLHDLDDAAEALHEKNKKALPMLHGLLDGSPNEQLLDQIPKGP